MPSPYIAIEFVDGAAEVAPAQLDGCVAQLAAQLARIHAVGGADPDLAFLPRQADRCASALGAPAGASDDERRIRAALAGAWPPPQHNRSALLHGDFWPGNVLWQAGRLAALIDWEDAAVGDPLADLANGRLEILWAWGRAAMERFTGAYLAAAAIDDTYLPDWELYAALKPAASMSGWGLGPAAEAAMRSELGWFVGQAIERIARR